MVVSLLLLLAKNPTNFMLLVFAEGTRLRKIVAGAITSDVGSNLTQFYGLWDSLMLRVVRTASLGSSRLKYATGEAEYTTFRKIYSLMQCTPDLFQTDCESCLRETVGAFQRTSMGSREVIFRDQAVGSEGGGISSQTIVIIVVVPIMVFLAVVLIASAILFKTKKEKQENESAGEESCEESFQFDFNAVRIATDNFSDTNKLGKGVFGVVYKGKLQDGQDIAVKRLCGNSEQGEREFKNEVLLMAKLEHKNLVRLLGFSFGKEREFSSMNLCLIQALIASYLVWSQSISIGFILVACLSRL
ncbi:hypothetical protein PTKIN_Ptkin01aG0131200 [Pterospermum kingtungense]